MSIITKLSAGKSREKRVNMFLDGKFAFSLSAEVALGEGLQVGQELSANQVETLARSDRYHRCLNAAIRYLGYRPRSEAEMSQRLQQRGFDNDCTEKVLARLREEGLLDDTAFARFWKENRESFSPRSQRLTRLELQRKGLDSSIVRQVVAEVDDSDSAYRAALSKAHHLSPSDYSGFRRRLGEYLKRRGFGYEVINHTVERVWKEYGSSPG
jgi:regulatory protein